MKKRKVKNIEKAKKAKNITLDILEFILSIPIATIDGFLHKGAIFNEFQMRDTLTCDLRVWIENLKQRGYLEEKIVEGENKNNKSIRLTNKAKLKVVDCIAEKIQRDNKFRFVSFDIPEENRQSRNRFRNALKMMGFKKIQASLWVIDKNVSKLVEMAAYEYKVEKYIVYIVSEKSDIDGYISKMFQK